MRILLSSLLFIFLVPVAIHAQWTPEFAISPPVLGAPPGPQSYSSAASDGSGFLVVWSQGPIFAARVSTAGELIDRTPINVSGPMQGANQTPSVAWNGQAFLVVWRFENSAVYGRLLSRDGRPIGPVRNVNDHGSGWGGPYVASNGDSFLVVSGGSPLQMAMVSRDGIARVLNATGLNLYATAVASDGRDFLIAGTRAPYDEAAVIKVSAQGEIVANYAAGRSSWPPHLAWTGTEYLLLTRGALLGVARLDTTGAPIGGLISLGPDRLGNHVAMGSPGDGTAMVVSEDLDADDSVRNLTFTRITSAGAEPRQDLGARGRYPAIACGSGAILLVWSGSDALRHAILNPTARLSPSDGTLTSLSAAEQRRPFAAATRLGWFLVWEETGGDDHRRARGAVVTSALSRGELCDCRVGTRSESTYRGDERTHSPGCLVREPARCDLRRLSHGPPVLAPGRSAGLPAFSRWPHEVAPPSSSTIRRERRQRGMAGTFWWPGRASITSRAWPASPRMGWCWIARASESRSRFGPGRSRFIRRSQA